MRHAKKRWAPELSIENVIRTLERLDRLKEIPCFRKLGDRSEESVLGVARCVGNDDAYWAELKRTKRHDQFVTERRLLLSAAWKERGG